MRLTVERAVRGRRVRVSRRDLPEWDLEGTIISTPRARANYYSRPSFSRRAVWVRVRLRGHSRIREFRVSWLSEVPRFKR